MKKNPPSLLQVRITYLVTTVFLLGLSIYTFTQSSVLNPFFVVILFLGAFILLFASYLRLNTELHYSHHLQKELVFQNEEKEKRATELSIANEELIFQNQEKEKRATELSIANKELIFQNQEKEKRATELDAANKELQLFAHISSHDLQEPLRKLQMATSRIAEKDYNTLSDKGKEYFKRIQEASRQMQDLLEDLIEYARTNDEERNFERISLGSIIEEVIAGLQERIKEKHAVIEANQVGEATVIHFQFRQLIDNLIGNALKFSNPNVPPHITISSQTVKGKNTTEDKLLPEEEYCHISITDNGIGFDPKYSKKIFEVFQRLNGREIYKGTGIGLAIAKKVVENHKGVISAKGEIDHGATFDIYIPTLQNQN